MRFQVLVDNVELSGASLLDVGCGLADLWGFLKSRKIPADYTGVDITEGILALARAQHPDARLECVDIFARDPYGSKRFDVAFCSGIFNLELGNNRQFLPAAIERLFELARRYVVFNLLHVRARRKYAHCAYYDPAEVLSLLRERPCQARLVDDYLPNDFTVICRLDQAGVQADKTAPPTE